MSPERSTFEDLQLFYKDPKQFAYDHHAQRIPLLNELNLTSHWVIDGCLGGEVWERIKTVAIPLMPKPGVKGVEERFLQVAKSQYGDSAFFLLFRDESSMTGWTAIAVLEDDLEKDGETLILEGLEAKRKDNHYLNNMKKAAFLVTQASLVKKSSRGI